MQFRPNVRYAEGLPIQRYQIAPKDVRPVTVQGKKGKCVFDECKSNWVEYNNGEANSHNTL